MAYSQERLASGVCQSNNGYLWQIADEAWRAVMACDAFRTTIRTSPWAAPLRTSFWARAQGAYGSAVRIDFYANGGASYGQLVEVDNEIEWRSQPATYEIERTGSASAPRIVRVVHGGETTEFTLGVQNPTSYDDAPLFTLEPTDKSTPVLYSLVSECDA